MTRDPGVLVPIMNLPEYNKSWSMEFQQVLLMNWQSCDFHMIAKVAQVNPSPDLLQSEPYYDYQ